LHSRGALLGGDFWWWLGWQFEQAVL